LHKKAKNNYTIGVLVLAMLMVVFTYEGQFVLTTIMTLLSIAFDILLKKIRSKYEEI